MCLVHENEDCIIDLVRNLNYLDPDSTILLYNGGTNSTLLNHFPFEKYGAIIYPNPKPLKWGWLHDFAIDCMEYAINNLQFDTITVVDSDQLGCGKNYTDYISSVFYNNPNLGMLGQVPSQILANTTIHPAITAYSEIDLWQPLLNELPNGKDAFLYWTFWPSTVFTYKASVALTNLFRTNNHLKEILTKTKIWASEEIILPTLVIALGFSIVQNPCVYDYVKYKVVYTNEQIKTALEQKNTFWIHPVVRDIRNRNRAQIRAFYNNYTHAGTKQLATQFSVYELNTTKETHAPRHKRAFPLVSCIMPTYNRPEFIRHAVAQFLEQSYPNKELIIIDDSETPVESLIPVHAQIKYKYFPDRCDLGSKRNTACKISNGEYIIHLDDDDYYAPDWIEKQVSFLIDKELEITGMSKPLFYDKTTGTIWQYAYPAAIKTWVYGATLCYTKKIWELNPFPAINCGEDNAFVWAPCVRKILANNLMGGYLGQIHDENTSIKQTNNNRWSKLIKEEIDYIFRNKKVESIPIF